VSFLRKQESSLLPAQAGTQGIWTPTLSLSGFPLAREWHPGFSPPEDQRNSRLLHSATMLPKNWGCLLLPRGLSLGIISAERSILDFIQPVAQPRRASSPPTRMRPIGRTPVLSTGFVSLSKAVPKFPF